MIMAMSYGKWTLLFYFSKKCYIFFLLNLFYDNYALKNIYKTTGKIREKEKH